MGQYFDGQLNYSLCYVASNHFRNLTVALVIRNKDSWLTVSTSGELFIIVFTRVCGRQLFSFAPGEA